MFASTVNTGHFRQKAEIVDGGDGIGADVHPTEEKFKSERE